MKGSVLLILTVLLLFSNNNILLGQNEVSDFPLTEYKTENESAIQIFYISGDGGLNEFSKSLCAGIASRGYSVIALDAKKYFWSPKTPETFVKDLSTIIRHFQQLWKVDSFVLLGYSFGADVVAFMPGRLPEDLVKKIRYSFFLNPSPTTDFEVKLMDLLGKKPSNRKYDVSAEINSITHIPATCLFSEDDYDGISDRIYNDEVEIRILPGDHRFNHEVDLIISTIIASIGNN